MFAVPLGYTLLFRDKIRLDRVISRDWFLKVQVAPWGKRASGLVVGLSGGQEFFLEKNRYTHACAFRGTTRFRALDARASQSLFFGCVWTHTHVG